MIKTMKKNILTIIVAFVAVVSCLTGCKPEYTTYSGPNYIMFSDTLYEMAVVDNESYFDVPVVATRSCDYDRNVAVEVGNEVDRNAGFQIGSSVHVFLSKQLNIKRIV